MHGRRSLAALTLTLTLTPTLTLTLTLLVIVPIGVVAYNLAEDIGRMVGQIRLALDTGHVEPPAWISEVPIIGDWLYGYLAQLVSSREQMIAVVGRMLEPARHYLLGGGMVLGAGVAQMSLTYAIHQPQTVQEVTPLVKSGVCKSFIFHGSSAATSSTVFAAGKSRSTRRSHV